MSHGLSPEVRKYLDTFDRSEIWSKIDLDDVRAQAALTLSLYPLPPMSLARLLMEQAAALDLALLRAQQPDGDLEEEVTAIRNKAVVLASTLSRRGRGRPAV